MKKNAYELVEKNDSWIISDFDMFSIHDMKVWQLTSARIYSCIE